MTSNPILVRMQLVNVSNIVPSSSVFLRLEDRFKAKLSPAARSLWTRIQGATIPDNCFVFDSLNFDPETGDILSVKPPELYSMKFYSLEENYPDETIFSSRFWTNYLNEEDWVKCGLQNSTYILWSRKHQCFATMYVHETIAMPMLLRIGLEEMVSNVACDITNYPFVERLSEKQACFLFDQTSSTTVRNYFHLACQASVSEHNCKYAILLNLPASKLDEVVCRFPNEINKPCTDDGMYPINLAANAGRIDALQILVANGADMHLGPESPFVQAIENGQLRFLQTMIRLGYIPKSNEEKTLIEKRLTDEERVYVFG